MTHASLAPFLSVRRWRFTAVVALQALFLVLACQTETTGPGGAIASVEISPTSSNVRIGAAVQFQAVAKDSAGSPIPEATIDWSTSAPSVASLDANGKATGVSVGTAVIRASSGGKDASARLTVSTSGPAASHVIIVTLENRDYSDVIGASDMPYLNGLASQYSIASSFYANTHPSIGNYFTMTVGAGLTNDDTFKDTVRDDNVVRHLVSAGKHWKAYAEDLPSVGYVGGDQGMYSRHHNPVTYFSDVIESSAQRQNIVPLSALATDISHGQLPDYAIIVPNECNNGHNCTNATVDSWLQATLQPLLSSAAFQDGGLLIIWYDEARTTSTYGGGRIPIVLVGQHMKHGFVSTTLYQHQSILRLALKTLGVTSYPGAAATAPDMDEFFGS